MKLKTHTDFIQAQPKFPKPYTPNPKPSTLNPKTPTSLERFFPLTRRQSARNWLCQCQLCFDLGGSLRGLGASKIRKGFLKMGTRRAAVQGF